MKHICHWLLIQNIGWSSAIKCFFLMSDNRVIFHYCIKCFECCQLKYIFKYFIWNFYKMKNWHKTFLDQYCHLLWLYIIFYNGYILWTFTLNLNCVYLNISMRMWLSSQWLKWHGVGFAISILGMNNEVQITFEARSFVLSFQFKFRVQKLYWPIKCNMIQNIRKMKILVWKIFLFIFNLFLTISKVTYYL